MRTHKTNLLTLFQVLMLTCGLSFVVVAQTTSATDGSTPLGLAPGAPAGSYALSGFDNVNLYNGNLSFQLPLLNVSGRGGAQMPVMLPIAGKWRISDLAVPVVSEQTLTISAPNQGIIATAVYQRTITNLDERGNRRPAFDSSGRRHVNNF